MGDSGTSNNSLGTVISYMGTTPPMNYLACDGTVYNIEDYQELADYINTHFGSKNFFGGNGTTTFAVPDLRGEFLRGTGTNSRTYQGNGANVGVHQDASAIRSEWLNPNGRDSHEFYTDKEYQQATSTNYPANVLNADTTVLRDYIQGSSSLYERTIGGSTNSIGNQDFGQQFTVRPTNTSVLYCIRYNTPKGKEIEIWQPSTDYEINQLICDTKGLYICKIDHTSSNDFLTDVLAGKWSWIGKEGANNVTQTTLYSGSSSQTAQTTVEYSLSDSTDNYDYLLLTYGNNSFKTDIIPVNDLFYSNGFFFSLTYNYDVNGWIQGKTNKNKVDIKVTTATQGNATIIKSIEGIKLNTLTTADIAELSMPSNVYETIALTPTISNDVASFSFNTTANGYVYVLCISRQSNAYINVLFDNSDDTKLRLFLPTAEWFYSYRIDISKSTNCTIQYPASQIQNLVVRFIYTVGDAKNLGLLGPTVGSITKKK